jgi:hypothetical protein
MPEWWRSKWRPFGVIVPLRRCSGVREAPVPVVPGALANVLTIFASNLDGCP